MQGGSPYAVPPPTHPCTQPLCHIRIGDRLQDPPPSPIYMVEKDVCADLFIVAGR